MLAIISAVTYSLLPRLAPEALSASRGLDIFLLFMIMSNVSLAIFNMLPIPPLDGSRVVEKFLPYRMRGTWEQVVQYSPFLLLGVIFFGRGLIDGPIGYFTQLLLSIRLS